MKRETSSKRLYLELSTPTKMVFRGFVDGVSVPIEDGMVGILPGHVNTLARVVPGIIKAKSGNRIIFLMVSEGFMEVAKDKVYIITEYGELGEKLNEEELKKEETELKNRLNQAQNYREREELRKSLLLNYLKQKALKLSQSVTYSTK
ncbi:ATP synthase F1 subunit epsilon [Dictyoglomus thermophilum]|uniref:ATP synthase epsilon chain n=2 Tax=Dictyoglomus thermophilum TaxID=14 RepID=B5YBP7_DICT6|nr:ATP synthase F1 subunit epsilon [Dictyoglomus thermophilum]ACI19126.1 ATP synthase F1, epsilon subunit [Dictyoglomus thermophilum H-6-12]MCX7720703.1 ATP synthase F1 subunit epsilon [Dictyoglomus thermophilum]TYT24161.1 ATP synthase F1 subunit epsilon [Dictyoglomus thermophilum]